MNITPFAAIDIGSNTIRMIIAHRASGTPPWQILHYHHHIARLGDGVRKSGRLGEAGAARALSALHDLLARCQRFGVATDHIYATATAAVRQAENGQDFCRMVERECKILVRILSGDEEAALSLRGAATVLESEVRQSMLLFDIGGGSTEFITVRDGAITHAISRPLGVIRLVEEGLQSNPPTTEDWQCMRNLADAELDAVDASWAASPSSQQATKHLVGTAGTVTTLAAVAMDLHPYDAAAINRFVLKRAHFDQLKNTLCAMDLASRQAIPAIEQGRADLIIAGLVIIEAIFDRWGHTALRTVDSGLMEGVLSEALTG
ncbi:MAG: Ppx/GppA phosphatase family protein [Mariprofundales bacterium]|nr:Ppx/GppA phosphatase family protein [Mariprofundales bacterium]